MRRLTQVRSDSTGPEINIVSIRSLEKQLEEGTGDVIQLKQARNSLLNVTTLIPPEILGYIFRWNVIPGGDYPYIGEVRGGSYNFLLVCHHWFEVASRTPALWSFWGNSLEQWSRRCNKSARATPVDLVLSRYLERDSPTDVIEHLRDALRERTACDTIRSVHLQCRTRRLLHPASSQHKAKRLFASVLSSLTPDGEEIRNTRIEAITIRYADVSDFFSRYRFPKLHYLHLSNGIGMTSWEHLGLHTEALTTLHLSLGGAPRPPTTSQLLLILASNPRLQDLALYESAIPRENTDGSTFRVSLRHLKKLSLNRDFRSVFQLLSRLDHPESVDKMKLTVSLCTVEDVLGTIGPYLRDHLRRDGRFRDGLGILLDSYGFSISIQARTISGDECPAQAVTFVKFTAGLRMKLSASAEDKLCVDLVAYTPREHVVYFGGTLNMEVVRQIAPTMPRIKEVHLFNASLASGFLQPDPDGPLANTKLFPSLRHIHLNGAVPEVDDWSPLISYLTHQTSDGRAISLALTGGRYHVCKSVMKEMEGLVDKLILNLLLDEDCRFGDCSMDESEEDD